MTLAACGGSDPVSPAAPGTLAKVSGDSQSIVVTQQAAQPMVVRVLARNGSPLAGAVVNWTLTSAASGLLAGTSSTTDADGRASMVFSAGTIAGSAQVSASVDPLATVIQFTHTLLAGTPATLRRASGDGVAALVNSAVQIVARATDTHGNPVPGVPVTFATGAAGGTLSALSDTSDSGGLARVAFTLGATPGDYTVSATSAGLGTVTFTVTGI